MYYYKSAGCALMIENTPEEKQTSVRRHGLDKDASKLESIPGKIRTCRTGPHPVGNYKTNKKPTDNQSVTRFFQTEMNSPAVWIAFQFCPETIHMYHRTCT